MKLSLHYSVPSLKRRSDRIRWRYWFAWGDCYRVPGRVTILWLRLFGLDFDLAIYAR